MKTRTIVMLMGAVAIYALCGVIAWDQIRRLQDEKAETTKDLKAAKEEIRQVKLSLKKAQEGEKEWMDRCIDMGNKSKAAIDANEKLVNLLNQKIAVLESSANTVPQQPTRNTYASSAVVSPPAKVNIPRWIPEAPVVVARKIKERATREHGNDFSGAKYEIEWQTEAYDKLLRYYRMNNPTVNDLLAKAAFEKGEDYRSMVWEVERQLDAAQKIQGN